MLNFHIDIKFEYGVVDQLSPRIRRVIANNPSAFTFTGTGTYIIGTGNVAVIDPGPLLDDHVDSILNALEPQERVSHILVTHTHLDHSPACTPLQARTKAPIYGCPPPKPETFDGPRLEEDADDAFKPDHIVADGDIISGQDWTLEAVATPGHMANHVCYALREEKTLFTGDHVMGWSTSIIAPPDGNMQDYMDSLARLLTRDDEVYWPTHGPCIPNPKEFVEGYIQHRQTVNTKCWRALPRATRASQPWSRSCMPISTKSCIRRRLCRFSRICKTLSRASAWRVRENRPSTASSRLSSPSCGG